MPKLNLKASRPKSKADRLRERRNQTLVKNHFDLMEENMKRKDLLLDEVGPSSDEDETPEEFTSRLPETKHPAKAEGADEKQTSDKDDEEEDTDFKGVDPLPDASDIDEDEEGGDHESVTDDEKKENDYFEDEEDEADEEEEETTAKKFTDISGLRKVFNSDDEADGKNDGILRFKTNDASYQVVALAEVLPSTFIKPSSLSRKEMLLKDTARYRVKERQDYDHVKKCRRHL